MDQNGDIDESRRLVVFTLDERLFAWRLSDVERVLRAVELTPLPGAPASILGVFRMGHRVIPVIDTRLQLGMRRRPLGLHDHLLVARTAAYSVAFLVDNVRGVYLVDESALITGDSLGAASAALQGVVRIGDELAVLFDLDAFLPQTDDLLLNRALLGSG